MTVYINNILQKEKRRNLRKNQTPEENKIWTIIRNKNLGVKWRRQVSIGVYIADFYCREKQLVIELDGMQHIDNKEYDLERGEYFEGLGIITIRFWNYEINSDIRLVKNKITELIQATVSRADPLKVNYY